VGLRERSLHMVTQLSLSSKEVQGIVMTFEGAVQMLLTRIAEGAISEKRWAAATLQNLVGQK
jgi:hypothetical protein